MEHILKEWRIWATALPSVATCLRTGFVCTIMDLYHIHVSKLCNCCKAIMLL